MTDQLAQFLQIAVSAAGQAVMVIRARAREPLTEVTLARRDVKIDVDRDIERLIVDALGETGIPVIGEEGVAGNSTAPEGLYWLVDPLDGTANFTRGIPIYCVAIALMDDGLPVAGVVHDVIRDECFSGAIGLGLTVNGVPASVSGIGAMERAVLATGLPARSDFSAAALEGFGRDLARWFKVRILGSAALSLAYVAAGRIDAYREVGVMPWDVMAGVALVRAGGGDATMTWNDVRAPLDIRAANRALLAQMGKG